MRMLSGDRLRAREPLVHVHHQGMANSGVARLMIGNRDERRDQQAGAKTSPHGACAGPSPRWAAGSAWRRARNIRGPSSQAVARKKTTTPNPAKSRNGTARRLDCDRDRAVLPPSRPRAQQAAQRREDQPGNARARPRSAIWSAKKLATMAVTAGMSMTLPTTMPSPAAMEISQPSAVAAVCACGPDRPSRPACRRRRPARRSGDEPDSDDDQMSASARPIDFTAPRATRRQHLRSAP